MTKIKFWLREHAGRLHLLSGILTTFYGLTTVSPLIFVGILLMIMALGTEIVLGEREMSLKQNAKTLKDYLKDEIEYVNASGEFEDKKALDKKIGEIHGFVDISIKDIVLAEHKKAIDEVTKQIQAKFDDAKTSPFTSCVTSYAYAILTKLEEEVLAILEGYKKAENNEEKTVT